MLFSAVCLHDDFIMPIAQAVQRKYSLAQGDFPNIDEFREV